MAAFTLKEMDTEIPAGRAKTRGYAMAGMGSISQNTSRKFSRKYMKNEGLRTPRERFAESAAGNDAAMRRILLKPYAKDRAAFETAARPRTPLTGGAGPEACGNLFSGKRRRKTAVSGLVFSRKMP